MKNKLLFLISIFFILMTSPVFAKEELTNYNIIANLDEKEKTIEAKLELEYINKYDFELKDVGFHLYANSYSSLETQNEIFKYQNEYIRKFSNKNPNKFLGNIEILKIKSDSKDLNFKVNDQFLRVNLQKKLKPGEKINLQIDYKINLAYGIHRLGYDGEVYSAAFFYPVVSTWNDEDYDWDKRNYSVNFESDFYDCSNFQVELEVDDELEVQITGKKSQKSKNNRKVIYARANNTREIEFFASKEYKILKKEKNGIKISYYYLNLNDVKRNKEKEEKIEDLIDLSFDAIEFFSNKYGEYTYEDLDIFETNINGAAIEYTRAIQLEKIKDDMPLSIKSTLTHEIAHQWFHGIIGNDSQEEPFLDESFSEFSVAYFFEKENKDSYGFDRITMLASSKGEFSLSSSVLELKKATGYYCYKIGPMLIFDLYCKMGEDNFDIMMQDYYNQYKFKNANIEDFLNILRNHTSKQIFDYFENCLKNPKYSFPNEYKEKIKKINI